jgi:REP element-mobilizing transposase RayT
MSRKYKFHNKEGLYFISFATVYWIDVFVRECYFSTLVQSLDYCRKNKGMEIYSWCIMPSHVHLIFRAANNNPTDIIRDFKTYTSKRIQSEINENAQESRRDWLLWFFRKAGEKNSNIDKGQFWQQNNKPIELWSSDVIDQKVDYIHENPVVSGFVSHPEHWKYSSAVDYCGGKGILEIDYI